MELGLYRTSSGRRDQLRIYFINGYTRNVSFSYTAPYSNKKLTEGFTIGGGYLQKRELSIKTNSNDSLLFYPDLAVYGKVNLCAKAGMYTQAIPSAGPFYKAYFWSSLILN